MQETRTEWQKKGGGGGSRGTYRDTCVQIGFNVRYKKFFFFFTAPQSSIGLYCFYQNIHVLNVKWI